jgi:hypothetical protein
MKDVRDLAPSKSHGVWERQLRDLVGGNSIDWRRASRNLAICDFLNNVGVKSFTAWVMCAAGLLAWGASFLMGWAVSQNGVAGEVARSVGDFCVGAVGLMAAIKIAVTLHKEVSLGKRWKLGSAVFQVGCAALGGLHGAMPSVGLAAGLPWLAFLAVWGCAGMWWHNKYVAPQAKNALHDLRRLGSAWEAALWARGGKLRSGDAEFSHAAARLLSGSRVGVSGDLASVEETMLLLGGFGDPLGACEEKDERGWIRWARRIGWLKDRPLALDGLVEAELEALARHWMPEALEALREREALLACSPWPMGPGQARGGRL